MKKSSIYIKDSRLYADPTKDKILLLIPITIIGSIIFYFILVAIQTNMHIFENRVSSTVVLAVLDVIPPAFWAGVLACIGIVDIVRLSIILVHERREE